MNTISHNDLTIISVYHNALSKRLLELNYDTVSRLNPGMHLPWLAADNTPLGFTDAIDEQKFTVVSNKEDYHGLGSHQHAGGINKCLKEVKTRFVLSLDSDFYILRKNWIEDSLAYMKEYGLSFFGAAYPPQEYQKYRYFPCVVCMVIDLEKVPLETLDFSPQMEFTKRGHVIRTEKDHDTRKKILRKKIKKLFPQSAALFFAKILRTFDMTSRRIIIGSARDTSYKIFEKYGTHVAYKCACVQEVFNPAKNEALNGRIFMPLNRCLERLLPDSLCYVPKKQSSFTAKGFRQRGFADCEANGWEEFIWQEKPFGIHMRGSKTWKRNTSEDDEFLLIKKTLEMF